MNQLLEQTLAAIKESGHTIGDIRWVGSRDGRIGLPWDKAKDVLDVDCDNGYGAPRVACDLVVVFTDGGFLRRWQYEADEGWEYEPPIVTPERQKPFRLVNIYRPEQDTLSKLNYPMEEADV